MHTNGVEIFTPSAKTALSFLTFLYGKIIIIQTF